MNQIIAILILGLMQLSCISPYGKEKKGLDNCKCTINANPIISFKDKKNNHLIFCGNLEKKISEDKYIISGFKLINCNENKEIIDESVDEISKFFLTIKGDSLLIANTQFVLNKDWNIEPAPVMEMTVKFIQGKPQLSSKRNVFIAPAISREQQDSLITMNKNLKEKAKAGKSIYPYDEKSIYLLFLGAINGNEEAKYTLKNLDKLFILDGAVAETRGEIWIDY